MLNLNFDSFPKFLISLGITLVFFGIVLLIGIINYEGILHKDCIRSSIQTLTSYPEKNWTQEEAIKILELDNLPCNNMDKQFLFGRIFGIILEVMGAVFFLIGLFFWWKDDFK